MSDSSTNSYELAQIVQHNLTHHHLWTGLRLETLTLPADPSNSNTRREYTVCTGVPREQLHPDDAPVEPEGAPRLREWVLPVKTDQKWSIREWAEIFAAIKEVDNGGDSDTNGNSSSSGSSNLSRVIMAAVTNDGTVVYYFVNKGITKPRKN
jgi:tRNA-splicing endonuclease subunit Sen15